MRDVFRNIFFVIFVLSFCVGPGFYAQEVQINNSANLAFVPNSGQWDDFISYRANLNGGVFWMEDLGWTAWLAGKGYDDLWSHRNVDGDSDGAPESLDSHAWRVRFKDGNTDALKSGRHQLGHKVNYYRGSDQTKWVTGLIPVGQVRYDGVWPGVNLIMDGRKRGTQKLKYDWVVEPGADPSAIRLIHEGTEISIRPDGSLLHKMGEVGDVVEGVPFAYQLVGSKIVTVECAYRTERLQDGRTEVYFDLGDYDESQKLIIDPDIVFGTFIGSTQANWGFTAAFDDDGRSITGAALWDGGMGIYPTTAGAISTTFAAGNGPFDIGISVFSADGAALEYSTIAGGNGMDITSSIVADSNGDFYVFGTTGSSNFPITAGAYDGTFNGGPTQNLAGCCFFPGDFGNGSDLFILKFSSGTIGLLNGTYVGGTGNDGINSGAMLNYNYGDVFRGEVNVDELDRPWIATVTSSTNFPMINGPYPSYNGGTTDGVLFRMSPDLGALEWSSYVGGSQADAAYGVQFTSAFEPVVCGGTRSTDYPALGSSYQFAFGGVVDAFVTRFPNGGGTPIASTYFGSSSYDQSYFVQLDEDDRIYLYGQTEGDTPLVGDVYDTSPNAGQFVACFDENLQNLLWHTRVGNPNNSGNIDISPTAFLVSDCGQIYMSGWGGNTNTGNSPYASFGGTGGMPISADAYQWNTDDSDFWLGMLDPGAETLVYGTYFGGSTSAEHVDGGTSRFDKNGTVYQAVCAGCGGNSDFPTTPGAWSSTNESFNCNLGLFKFELGIINVDIDLVAPEIICPDEPIQFVNNSQGGGIYLWQFGDGEISEEFEPNHTYASSGDWEVSLTVSDPQGCLDPQTATLELTIEDPIAPTVDLVLPICPGDQVQLNAWGTDALFWFADPTLSATDIPNPIATPTETTTYTVFDENGCGAGQAEVTVEVGFVEAEVNTPATTICLGDDVQLVASGGVEYSWFPPGGLDDPSEASVSASPNVTTGYTVTVSDEFGCSDTQTIQVTVVPSAPGGQVYEPIEICTGYGASLPGGVGDAWLWDPTTSLNSSNVQNPYASPTSDITYTVSIQNVCGIGEDEISVSVIIPTAQASESGSICRGDEFHVGASGGDPNGSTFNWSPAPLVSQSTSSETFVFPSYTTTFTVYVTDSNGCTESDELTVYVGQPPSVNAGPDRDVEWLDQVRLLGSTSGETYWWTPAENLSCSFCTMPEVTSLEPGWYVFHAIDETGCEGTDSTFLDIFYPIFVPTSFTPNNDGINDVFFVEGIRLQGYRLIVYNRWGEEVYYSEDAEEVWTGAYQNGSHFCEDGIYLYALRYEDQDGPHLIHGHLALLR